MYGGWYGGWYGGMCEWVYRCVFGGWEDVRVCGVSSVWV